MKEQIIYKNGCWGCKRAWEFADWQFWNSGKEQYICPKYQQHLIDYENMNENNNRIDEQNKEHERKNKEK